LFHFCCIFSLLLPLLAVWKKERSLTAVVKSRRGGWKKGGKLKRTSSKERAERG